MHTKVLTCASLLCSAFMYAIEIQRNVLIASILLLSFAKKVTENFFCM